MPVRKRSIATLTGTLLVAHAIPAVAALSDPAARVFGAHRRMTGAGGAVALTLDDGPHPEGTPIVLDELDRAGVTATFFLVGEQIRKDYGLAREVAARGHAVGVHCDRHRNLLRLTPGQVRYDLDRAANEVAECTGALPTLYRPPYGILSAAAMLYARRRGWRTVLWSKAGRDWRAAATAESITRESTTGLSGGDIVLLHDADHYSAPGSWRATADALPAILDAFKRAELAPVALQEGELA